MFCIGCYNSVSLWTLGLLSKHFKSVSFHRFFLNWHYVIYVVILRRDFLLPVVYVVYLLTIFFCICLVFMCCLCNWPCGSCASTWIIKNRIELLCLISNIRWRRNGLLELRHWGALTLQHIVNYIPGDTAYLYSAAPQWEPRISQEECIIFWTKFLI
jgi:hypothetical protein